MNNSGRKVFINLFHKKLFGIYLLVGGWNTVFGTLTYFFFVWLCDGVGRFGYLLAAILSTLISVSHSFITYKLLVFKTKGNWLQEYIKCWSVYGMASIINFCLLPFIVEFIRFVMPIQFSYFAPYIGGVLLTGITVLFSFLGHKEFTFKKNNRVI